MRSLELAVLLGGMFAAEGQTQVGIGTTPTTGNAPQASHSDQSLTSRRPVD